MRTVVKALLWGMLVVSFLGSVSVFAGRLKSARPAVSGVSETAVGAFAEAFAREYLTWDGSEPADFREARLEPFLAAGLRNQGGFRVEIPAGQKQNVVEARVWEIKRIRPGFYLADILVTLSGGRRVVLAVPVGEKNSRLFVYALPSLKPFVSGGDGRIFWGPSAGDLPGLKPMLEGFFRAYLEGRDKSELANYAADGARLVPMGGPARFEGLRDLRAYRLGEKGGRYAVEVVAAVSWNGARFDEQFTVFVISQAGKFYVDSVLP